MCPCFCCGIKVSSIENGEISLVLASTTKTLISLAALLVTEGCQFEWRKAMTNKLASYQSQCQWATE